MKYVGIDPSTKTGVLVLNETSKVLLEKEVHLKNGIFSTERELLDYGRDIISMFPAANSVVGIEGFSYGSQGKGVSTQYAVGYSIRFALLDAGIPFIEVAPSQLKKFATGKGNTTKDNMTIPILRHWNFEHKSDNVRDAYVLAQIVKTIHHWREGDGGGGGLTQYQADVIEVMLNPPEKKRKAK